MSSDGMAFVAFMGGLVLGSWVGALIVALLRASKEADQAEELAICERMLELSEERRRT